MSKVAPGYNERPGAAILQMLEETRSPVARRFRNLRSLVIMQDGCLLCARSYNGDYKGNYHLKDQRDDTDHSSPETNPNPSTITPIHSVTKSVVALLTGILLDHKLIDSVDQPLSELLGSRLHYLDNNPQAGQLTLHQLLSMTTGILWRDARVGLEPMAGRMMQQNDWVKFALSLPVTQGNVGLFQYNSAVSHLLSVVIQEAAGEPAAGFADKHLFSPLGISQFEWESDPQGVSIGGWGLSLSALDMAKLGQLCLDRGMYEGEPEFEQTGTRVISAQWIKQMWTPYCEARSLHGKSQPAGYDVAGYGYQWWIRGNHKLKILCAEGLGGQKIYCIPDLRAVIVTSSDLAGRRTSLWPLFEKHWLPALAAGV